MNATKAATIDDVADMAHKATAHLQIADTVNRMGDALTAALQDIYEAEELGSIESAEKVKFAIPLRSQRGELREVTIVVQVAQKPHKVQASAMRSSSSVNGQHTDGEVPEGQTTFLLGEGVVTVRDVVGGFDDDEQDDQGDPDIFEGAGDSEHSAVTEDHDPDEDEQDEDDGEL